MLMAATAVVQAASAAEEWMWHRPSLFSIGGWVVMVLLFLYLGSKLREDADVSPRDVVRITGRLDRLEEMQSEMMVSAGTRHEERLGALRELVDVSAKQYEGGEKQALAIKKLLAQNVWIVRSLSERPCVMAEGDACPDGHGATPSASPSPPPELLDPDY